MAVLALFVIELQLGAAVAARHQAEAAADLAALASAAQAVAGQDVACRSAARVAERMSTTLNSCELHGWDSVVRVSARPASLVEHFGVANAAARAGPVQTDQSSDGGVRREIHDERSTAIAERSRQN
jgi:secretion/DNA translocation related TadE-like protein